MTLKISKSQICDLRAREIEPPDVEMIRENANPAVRHVRMRKVKIADGTRAFKQFQSVVPNGGLPEVETKQLGQLHNLTEILICDIRLRERQPRACALRRELHLVRDRLGIKPLYYGWQGGAFLFGSELKALAAHPAFSGEIDRDALTLYMRFAYVPEPFSIYRNIYKLPPGTVLTLRRHDDRSARPRPFWSALEAAERGQDAPFSGSDAEAVARLDTLLREAVALRMVADVPLGAFLSGGIDSSTIAAFAVPSASACPRGPGVVEGAP